MKWVEFPNDNMKVSGLAWWNEEKPSVRRLPSRLKDTFREPVWELAQCPAGGRIRFRTDATHIGVRAKSESVEPSPHMTLIGKCGFDVYVDNQFMGSVSPDADGNIDEEWTIAVKPGVREITINLPLYQGVSISQIGIDEYASITDPAPYALEKPVVFYGSSITQGGCASTPGTSYQSFISRWLNIDFVNLGFSGNGLGEPELAAAVCEIDSSCIVMDHWGNKREGYAENLCSFVNTIRSTYEKVPVVIVSPFYWCEESAGDRMHDEQRRSAKAFVKKMQDRGDANLHYFDGRRMLSKADSFGLVDGVHCNTLGFYLIARRFAPYLGKILNLR